MLLNLPELYTNGHTTHLIWCSGCWKSLVALLNNQVKLSLFLMWTILPVSVKHCSKHDSETCPMLPFFINSSTVYKYSHTKCSQKTLMSCKHSIIPRLSLRFPSLCDVLFTLFQIYVFFSDATGSSCRLVVLSSRHTSYKASPPSCLRWHGRHVTPAVLSSDSQVQDEGGKRQKSQCEAGALDISALGAGPEVRNTTVLHGSASSLVCGGVGWGGVSLGASARSGSNG